LLLYTGTGNPAGRRKKIKGQQVGEANSCDYCVAAHTLLGGKAGLSREETLAARATESAEKEELKAFVATVATDAKVPPGLRAIPRSRSSPHCGVEQ
jgi:AhpD family alkylhydroperoxidase